MKFVGKNRLNGGNPLLRLEELRKALGLSLSAPQAGAAAASPDDAAECEPAAGFLSLREARLQALAQIRPDVVARLREEIQDPAYDSDEKIDAILDAILDALFDDLIEDLR